MVCIKVSVNSKQLGNHIHFKMILVTKLEHRLFCRLSVSLFLSPSPSLSSHPVHQSDITPHPSFILLPLVGTHSITHTHYSYSPPIIAKCRPP